MKAMTSRSWSLVLKLLTLCCFGCSCAGSMIAAETADDPEVGASPADGSSLEITTSESGDEPATIEPQEDEAAELEASDQSEPRALPRRAEDDRDANQEEPREENPDRVITPVPPEEAQAEEAEAETEEPRVAPRKAKAKATAKAKTRLMPAPSKGELEVMSFRAMRPGTSTKEDLVSSWGAPAEVRKVHGVVTYNYRAEDGSRTTVTLDEGVVSAVLVEIEPPAEPEVLAQKLGVDKFASIEVADDDGKILGEAFPERGLLFGYAADTDPVLVSQIVLESPEAQPFLLRAEAELDSNYARCLADANTALELDPKLAAAQAMRARVYRQAGDLSEALKAAETAVAMEPGEAEWRLVLAKVLVQLSDFDRAKDQIDEVLDNSATDPIARAGAYLLMGDTLALSSSRGYGAAVKQHQEAIRLAKTMVEDPRARRRRKACEILIDAHLHLAYSIAWGHFQHKSDAVQKWLEGASSLANDLVSKGVLRPEVQLRVNEQALAALAGLSDPPDATKWENAAIEGAKAIYEETTDPTRSSQIQWQLGLALCDAVQIEQTRHNYDRALDFGKLAFEHLKRADAAGRQLPDHDFLLGQLFYRLGVIHAVGRQDHKQALVWYGRAVVLLEAPVPPSCVSDPGRHGETFVSIAVSYWETGDQEEAIRLTRQGVSLMEQAVEDGLMTKASLAIPYGNLASMYNELGDAQQAREFAKLAAKLQNEKQ